MDEQDTHIEAMVLEGDRPVTLYANGYQFFR